MRNSKDLAKRLRYEGVPRKDPFRKRYPLIGLVAAVAGVALWLGLTALEGEEQYLPRPVAQNHATFGESCDSCHVSFAAVPDEKCLDCHTQRVHSEHEPEGTTPRCGACHVEHRDDAVFLNVSNALCSDCHGALETARADPPIALDVGSFADHPELSPLRAEGGDAAVLRFNHELHLTSSKMPGDETLDCPSCHVTADDGWLMEPIEFEPHCERCHEQVPITELPVKAPHEDPATVRASLEGQLLVLAVANPSGIFEGTRLFLPGRAARGPLSEADSLAGFRDEFLGKAEEALYAPLVKAPQLLEENQYCFLCHDAVAGTTGADLPEIADPSVPERWLMRGLFSHRKHGSLPCEGCHAGSATSRDTSDVSLPGVALCQGCHTDGSDASAGTSCMLCHLYHDTSIDPGIRLERAIQVPVERLVDPDRMPDTPSDG